MIALPVMGQQLIQSLVSLVDNFMVSGLGDIKMSGVNITNQILFIFMVLLGTICTSGGIFMTQFFGAGDKHGMKQSLLFKIVMSVICMLPFFYIGFLNPRPFLALMVKGNNQATEILDVAVKYIFLIGIAGIPMVVSNIIATCLREVGQVKAPLVMSVTATLVNTFLNWVLIYGHLGAPRLEVAGAAIATIIARFVEMLLYIGYLTKKSQPWAIRFADLFHVDWGLFGRILRRGGMVIFSEMAWVASETIITALYNGRGGADVVSGMSASFAIANLFFVAFSGITTATGILLGQSLGAGKLDKAREEARWMLTASFIFGCIMTLVGLLALLLIPIVFPKLSVESRAICREMVFYMSLFMPIWVYQNAQFAVSRAGGDTLMGVVVDTITTLLIAIPLMFFLAKGTNMGPVGMYICFKLLDFLKIAIAYVWLKKERWVVNLAGGEAKA